MRILGRTVLFLAMLASVAILTQCETDAAEDEKDVATDTTTTTEPSPTCSASGFTKIQDAIANVCVDCHNHHMGALEDEFSADDQQHNITTLTTAGYTNGTKLYDFIVSDDHGGMDSVADQKRADYTPWCIE